MVLNSYQETHLNVCCHIKTSKLRPLGSVITSHPTFTALLLVSLMNGNLPLIRLTFIFDCPHSVLSQLIIHFLLLHTGPPEGVQSLSPYVLFNCCEYRSAGLFWWAASHATTLCDRVYIWCFSINSINIRHCCSAGCSGGSGWRRSEGPGRGQPPGSRPGRSSCTPRSAPVRLAATPDNSTVYTGLFLSFCTFHSSEMIYLALSGILFSPQPIVEYSKLIVRPAVQSALSVLRCQQLFAMNCPNLLPSRTRKNIKKQEYCWRHTGPVLHHR